ncbi:MAG: arylesterase [Pedobacter sp.]|nr:arylesterase [Pedobacter sp.]
MMKFAMPCFCKRGFFLLLLVCAFPAGISSAQAATILVFGDSISAAYGLEVEQGWVRLLQQKLDKTAPGKHLVVNGSLSGETTSGGKARLPALLKKHKPDVVILELGGNDGLRGQPPALMAGNFKKMIADSRTAGARVLLFGMKIPPNYGRTYTQAFEQVFVTVSKEEKVPLLPFFLEGIGGNPALVQADGIHPVAKAQPILLQNAWPLIEKALK